MRVLFVTPYYAPDLGPSAALYEMLCAGLARMGCAAAECFLRARMDVRAIGNDPIQKER